MSTASLPTPMGLDLSALFASPRLPDIAQQINTRLKEEAQRRQRFYEEMTDECKMEFIDGEVVMHSPAKAKHVRVTGNILQILRAYVLDRDLGDVFFEKALCVFPRNDYEPDIIFFSHEKAAQIRPNTMKFPVPDLVVEVLSESTEKRDRGVKFEDYAAHGVREYWIVDAEAQILEQYVESDGGYELRLKSGSGVVASVAVPGFTIPIQAFFDSKLSLEVMREQMPAKD